MKPWAMVYKRYISDKVSKQITVSIFMLIKYNLHNSEDEDSKLLRKVDKHVPIHTASYSIRLFGLPWEGE
jgi:hypothetical protein